MKTQMIDVTPEMAKEWLKSNNSNRNLGVNLVARYKKDMIDGKWSMTHQGIAFYDDGQLADGQHRLKAVVESGCTIPFLVTFGIEKTSGADIDGHRARNTVDAIKIGGLADWIGKDEVSIINFMFRQSGTKSSPHQIAEKCKEFKYQLNLASRAFCTKVRNISSAPIMAAVVKASANGVSDNDLLNFCKVLTTGIPREELDIAALRLREMLIQNAHIMHGSASGRVEQHMKAQRAIKAFVNREKISKLMTPSEEIYPVK
jgi:hypothetical protein